MLKQHCMWWTFYCKERNKEEKKKGKTPQFFYSGKKMCVTWQQKIYFVA